MNASTVIVYDEADSSMAAHTVEDGDGAERIVDSLRDRLEDAGYRVEVQCHMHMSLPELQELLEEYTSDGPPNACESPARDQSSKGHALLPPPPGPPSPPGSPAYLAFAQRPPTARDAPSTVRANNDLIISQAPGFVRDDLRRLADRGLTLHAHQEG